MTIISVLFVLYMVIAVLVFIIGCFFVYLTGNIKKNWWIPPVYSLGWFFVLVGVTIFLWRNPPIDAEETDRLF